MRPALYPRFALTSLLALLLPLLLVGCSDGGSGTTQPLPEPAITVSLSAPSASVVQGRTGEVTVNVTRIGGFNGAVDLSLEGAPAGLTGTFTPASLPGGATSSTLTLNAATSTAAGEHNLTIRARGQGVAERTLALALTVELAPSIAVAVEPTSLELAQGASGTVVVTVTGVNSTTPVELTLEGAPDGVTGSFEPATMVPDGSSTLTVSVAAEAALGTSELLVRASAEGVEDRTVALGLTVSERPAVAVSVEPATLSIVQGASGGAVVRVARANFGGPVELSLEGAPEGVGGTFAPASLPPEAGEGTLSLAVGAEVPAGTTELVVRARGEGVDDATATLALTIDPAPAYELALDPSSLGLDQGETGTVEVQIERTNFGGAIALSVSGAPAGSSATVTPASTTGDAATLAVNVGAAAAPGTYTLTLTGQAQGLENRTATLELTVTQARRFELSVTPSSLTIEQGESGTATVTISRTAGFTSPVTLGIENAPAGMNTTIDPTTVSGVSATVTIEAEGSLEPGSYPLTIRGSAQVAPGQTHEETTSLVVMVGAVAPGDWVQVSTGVHHTCALNETGHAYCWGRNQFGQLGDGTTTQRMRPRLVTGGHTWRSVTVGGDHTCGITTAGDGFCWGAGSAGRLGNGSTANSATPEPIAVSGGDTWAMLSPGLEHTCGLTPDGRAYCWGRGGNGRLGNGSTANQTTRVLVAGDYTWQSVSTGTAHSCGLTTAGEAYCWGTRANGRVGDGGTSGNATIPSLVQGGHAWTWVSARSWHSCGITAAGDGYCWGRNDRGQLGIGNTADQSRPALVLNDHRWSLLRPGWNLTTCGITQSGEAFCWGDNSTGQVGDGTTGNKTAPQPVAGGFSWTRVSGGNDHTCAVSTEGVAYCWGRGSFGQLGNGSAASTIYRTPIRVLDPQ